MDMQEAAKIILLLSTNYNNFPEKGKEEVLASLWAMTFSEIPYKIMEATAVKHMMTVDYKPTLKSMMEVLNSIADSPSKTADEAWGSVCKAIRNYGSYRKLEALQSLDDVTRSIVEGMGFEYLCQSTNPTVDYSQFVKAYNTKIERKKLEKNMPKAIAQRIESVKQVMIE